MSYTWTEATAFAIAACRDELRIEWGRHQYEYFLPAGNIVYRIIVTVMITLIGFIIQWLTTRTADPSSIVIPFAVDTLGNFCSVTVILLKKLAKIKFEKIPGSKEFKILQHPHGLTLHVERYKQRLSRRAPIVIMLY